MIGMMQIIIYMLAFYMVLKGLELVQIALASGRTDRKPLFILGGVVLAACVIAAGAFVALGNEQAKSVSRSTSSYSPY
jgi:hypothetical protein